MVKSKDVGPIIIHKAHESYPETDLPSDEQSATENALLAHLKHTSQMVQDKMSDLDRSKRSAKDLEEALAKEKNLRETAQRRLDICNTKVGELENIHKTSRHIYASFKKTCKQRGMLSRK